MSFFPTCAMRNHWKLMRSYGESTTLETQSSSSNCGYRIDRDTQNLINSIEKNKNDPQLWNVSVMNHKSWSLKLCAGNRDRSISKKVINAPSNWKTCHQIEVIACSVSTHSHSGFAWLFRERCAKCFPVRNCVNDRRLRQMRCVCVCFSTHYFDGNLSCGVWPFHRRGSSEPYTKLTKNDLYRD